MNVNKISNTATNYVAQNNAATEKEQPKTDTKKTEEALVYETSQKEKENTDSAKKVYKRDDNVINQLKADAEKRNEQLRSLVEKMLLKQGEAYDSSMNIFQLLREGKVEVDPETAAQAKKDIAEDGYWGVEQTSERLVSFAIALTGGDTSKADNMIAAVKNGFEEATKIWGDQLPDLCQKTLDTTIEKLEKWKAGTQTPDATTLT